MHNDTSFFLAGFSSFIPGSDDILLGELSAIYHGLIMAKDLGYVEIACYSDSLACINLTFLMLMAAALGPLPAPVTVVSFAIVQVFSYQAFPVSYPIQRIFC